MNDLSKYGVLKYLITPARPAQRSDAVTADEDDGGAK